MKLIRAGAAGREMPDPRYLQPGGIVELGIDGLGTQRQRVVAYAGGAATPARG